MVKTVIVTGASGGIGSCIARQFALAGYNVVVNYNNNVASATGLVRQLKDSGFNAAAIKCDVRDERQVDNLIEETLKLFGNIDVLVNNAGVSLIKQVQDTTVDDYDYIMDTNLKGVFLMSKAVLPFMLDNRAGNIVNISSVWGSVGASCEVVYSASKAGVIGMTKALAKEVGLSGVRVNCVCAGMINTAMNSQLSMQDIVNITNNITLGRIGQADEVASVVVSLADDKVSSYITGQVITVDGGWID